jgi:tetratricopeptide (TPR) repeat protein
MAQRWLVGLAGLLLVAGAGGALWCWTRAPQVPVVPLDGLDREVADVVVAARQDIADNPRSAVAWAHLGRALLANEIELEVSLACFLEAERLDPDNPRWPYLAGGTLLNLGRPDDALPKLERAVALCDRAHENNMTPRLRLAETLAALGQAEAAARQCEQILAADPQNVRAHFDLGMFAAARGDWQQSRAHLLACVGSPQARKRACAQLAADCQRLGDRANADHYAALNKRLPKDFAWGDPYIAEHAALAVRKRDRYRIAEQLEAENKMASAARIVEGLVAKYPDDSLPHLMMGRILPQMGQFERAQQHLDKALQLSPDKTQVRYLMGLVLLRRGEVEWLSKNGDRQKAVALFEASADAARTVLAQRPDYGFAHMALGQSLKYLGRRTEALAAFREAVHCSPEFAEMHLNLGLALAEDGKLSEARPYLEQARILADPNDRRPAEALDKFFPGGDPKSKS